VDTPSTPIHHVASPISRLPAPINSIYVQHPPSGHKPFVCDAFKVLRIYYIGLKIVHRLINRFTRYYREILRVLAVCVVITLIFDSRPYNESSFEAKPRNLHQLHNKCLQYIFVSIERSRYILTEYQLVSHPTTFLRRTISDRPYTTDHPSKRNHETCIDYTTNTFDSSSSRLIENGISI